MLRVVLLLAFVGWLLTPPNTIKLPALDPLGLSGLTDARNWNPETRVFRSRGHCTQWSSAKGAFVFDNPYFK